MGCYIYIGFFNSTKEDYILGDKKNKKIKNFETRMQGEMSAVISFPHISSGQMLWR